MKSVSTEMILIVAGLALAGCSNGGSILNAKSNVPQANNVPVGNPLAMPPDLQLAVPTQTSENYQPNGPVEPVAPAANLKTPSTKPLKQMASATTAAPAMPKPDLYEQYGVSKVTADGKPKKPELLQAELKAAILKKKRETNPNYGTVSNIGAIFNDQ
jgi:hypothetical protein